MLSADPQTTTFQTWECLVGLSVSSRKLLLALARLDRALGRPAGRLGSWLGKRLLASMDDIHPISLTDPEFDRVYALYTFRQNAAPGEERP